MSDPLAAVRPLLAGALVALDFDGTLAPVVRRPQDARPADGALAMLGKLSSRIRQLAIVTGRPAQTVVELGDLARVPGLIVLGHYGLQRWSAGIIDSPEPVPGVAVARAALPALLPPGVSIEDKLHSVVVHTRTHPEPASVQRLLRAPLAELATRNGLELVPGRFVWELRPPGTDKGGALRRLAHEVTPSAVLVAGDDLGDLPMFAAARALGVPALRIAVVSADAPAQVANAADHAVQGPSGLVELLADLTA